MTRTFTGFLLCCFVFTGLCCSEPKSLSMVAPSHHLTIVSDATTDTSQQALVDDESLMFQNGIQVYLAPNTMADSELLVETKGVRTTFTDPNGEIWEFDTRDGLTGSDFFADGYDEAWFATHPSYSVERFFYCFIPAPPPPKKSCLMCDPSEDRCSVYIDAGDNHYARLDRVTDTGSCPTVNIYRTWLPRVTSK